MTARTARKRGGSTRRWRQIRKYVLARDRYRCRMTRNSRVCGRTATTCQHVVPKALGGTDDPSNLMAACGPCNYGEGAAIAAEVRRRASSLALDRSY